MKRRTLIALAFLAGTAVAPAFAGPIEDSQVLYDRLVALSTEVADAIQAPVSRPLARSLEAEVYEPIQAAWNAWEDAAFASGSYRSYSEFNTCRSAGQLLGYVTDEVIQHHLGNDTYSGTMKYRHAEPFLESLAKCETQILAARAETAAEASTGESKGL